MIIVKLTAANSYTVLIWWTYRRLNKLADTSIKPGELLYFQKLDLQRNFCLQQKSHRDVYPFTSVIFIRLEYKWVKRVRQAHCFGGGGVKTFHRCVRLAVSEPEFPGAASPVWTDVNSDARLSGWKLIENPSCYVSLSNYLAKKWHLLGSLWMQKEPKTGQRADLNTKHE